MRITLPEAGLSMLLLASTSCLAEPPAVPGHPSAGQGTEIINADVDVPILKPGLWEYRRTIGPEGGQQKEDVARHCTDPTADIRHKRAELAKRSCQFEPMFLKQNRYLSSWVCMTQKGAMRFHDVLIVTDDSHYVDKLESRSSDALTHQTIVAERIASCPLSEAKPGSITTTTGPTASPR